ncbi:MAG: LpxL/LpxP family Kdo(2)-lipid IV(A) lauroyl/palmitoleoyl acyltransferase [Gammaproteobacteria bacterium]
MQYQLLKPRYWSTWLLLGCMRLLVMCPYRFQLMVGYSLGWSIRMIAKRRWRVTLVNLQMCFPEMTEKQRLRIARKHFASIGMGIIEFGMCWWMSVKRLRRLAYQVSGVEHLQAARAQGHGVLLLAGHFTQLEMVGRILSLHTDLHLMYRPIPNPVIEEVMRRNRERLFDRAIPRNDVRALLKSLKQGKPIWYAIDQGYRGKGSIMVPFFGIPAPTSPALSRVARSSQAPVVPFFGERLPGGRGYSLRVYPALQHFPSDDPAADALRINKLLEENIRRAPEQYLWSHDRFKKVPRE